jgi:dUTP pyrophosphatase
MNYWKKLHPSASLERRSAGAQGVDLVACIDEPVTIMPEARTLIPLGVAIAAPSGALLILRSSAGVRGLALANGVGLIDADYRGEVKAILTAWAGAITIHPGDRVAQLVALDGGEWEEVEDLGHTERGEGGFGSTDSEVGYSDCPAGPGDWGAIDKDYKWMTVDSDGEVCAWKVKPYLLGNGEWEIDHYTPDTEPYNFGWVDEQEPKIWERPA